MADFKLNRIRFTWKGDWTATTSSAPTLYIKDDIVRYGGKSYVCLVGHGAAADFNTDLNFINTSTTPNTPAPKWGLWFDGYEWKDSWTPTTFYDLGDYVRYGSIVYICNNSHTSSSLVLGLENDQNKWTRYAVTDNWDSNWSVNRRYKLNDVVRYGGTVYRCNLGHTSALTLALGLEADILKWDVLLLDDDWKTDWLPSVRYKLNDVVRYGGIIYKCNLGHTSAATDLAGLEADIGKWNILHNGIDYKISWETNGVGYRYKLNDIVKFGANLFICTTFHVATTTFDTDKFAIWVPGLEYENQWDLNTSYQSGDIVTYGGYNYTSNVTNNLGNIPSPTAGAWTLLVENYNIRNDWTIDTEYRTGDLVRRNGYLYVARVDSVGTEPTNVEFWELVNPGVSWKQAWYGGTSAVVTSGSGDGVFATITFSSRQGAPLLTGAIVKIQNCPIPGYNVESAVIIEVTGNSITYANTTTTAFTQADGLITVAGQVYTLGDVVTYYSTAYICKQRYLSTPLVNPLLDTTVVLLPIKNAVSTGSITTITFDTQTTAPYIAGQSITVTGVTPSGYNITATVVSATTDSVSYEQLGFSSPYVSGGEIANNSQFWTLYAKGDQYQTLQYQGDIQTFDQGNWSTTTLGQNGSLLKVDGTLLPVPAWSNFGEIGDVYYVAGTGTDAPGFGSTLNNPFKTIRYACSVVVGPASIFIKTGTFFETLPISVPAGVALIGDELRGTTIQPALELKLTALSTSSVSGYINAVSTTGLTDRMPIRFTNASIETLCTGTSAEGGSGIIVISTAGMQVGDPIVFTGSAFGGLVSGNIYYILNIASSNTLTITAEQNSGVLFTLTTDSGTMTCIAGSFGGLSASVVYYVVDDSIEATRFKISPVKGGTPIALTATGGTINSGTTFDNILGASVAAAGTYNVTVVNNLPVPGIDSIAATGEGVSARFAVTKTGNGTTYTSNNTVISIVRGGASYKVGDTITILGTALGGASPTNNLTFTLGTGVLNKNINIYGGDVLQDMFYVRNATGIRNMTLRGLNGILGPANIYGTRRPLAGAYVSLDPGTGPSDSSTWIVTRSPYVQNVTTFGNGAVGCKIDGALHGGGNRSITSNDFTQVISDGIGIWCINSEAKTEAVSVFSYYGHIGYLAENGGRIRATNGNTSYGDFGTVAEGFDQTETALPATVNNRNQEAQIALAFSGEATNKIVKLEYSNAGQDYTGGSYSFSGSGTGAIAVMDEFRDGGIFEARITGSDVLAGGNGYIAAGNQAQAGDQFSITLASNDQGTPAQYVNTRLIITSGTGVGQYGFIQYIDEVSKAVNICRESFETLTATATTSVNNLITVASTRTLAVGMPIVFSADTQVVNVIRTTNASATMGASSIDSSGVLTIGTLSGSITVGMLLTGGTIANGVFITSRLTYSPLPSASPTRVSGGNPPAASFVVSSTAGIVTGMLVTGTGISANTTVVSVVSTTVTLSSNFQLQAAGTYNFFAAGTGSTWQTTTTTPQASTVISGVENTVTVQSTSGMWVTKPITFAGTTIVGGISANTTYYILGILPGNKLAISLSLNYPLQTVLNAIVGVNAVMVATASGTIGGVSAITPYYIAAANFSTTQFSISQNPSGTPITTLTTLPAGAMYINQLGWDNIVQATPSIPLLDSTSVYSIEPRVTFSPPTYASQSASSISNSNWVSIIFAQSRFLAISATGATATSTNGTSWQSQDSAGTPATAWTDLAYGAGRWVAVMSGTSSGSAYSTDGVSWFAGATILGTGSWNVCFGGNLFVAVCSGSRTVATSSDGQTWTLTALALPSTAVWTSIVWGSIGVYVAIASGGTTAASSVDGITWTVRTLPTSGTWTSVDWGNGRFVAIASGGAAAAYSFDGITWYSSLLPTATVWTSVKYGMGMFFAVASGTSAAASSPDGWTWTPRTLAASSSWRSVAFGTPTRVPTWCAVSNGQLTTTVNTGATAIGRAVVTSGKISLIKIWEPGSNYITATCTITDPNATQAVSLLPRIANGVLGNPTLVNQGVGYRSSTTVATITGSGFADIYQNSKLLSVSGLATIPTPGAALTFGGNLQAIYRIVLITELGGGQALFQVAPPLNNENAPEHAAEIFIRQKYSQCRITGHDFLLIGTGNFTATNYPNVDVTTAASFKQISESGGGRVFQTSTDQDGNFTVGNLFAVQQASGIVTISADQFSLTGLEELTLGGFALGVNSVIVNQFSTDSFFTANSDTIVPTQKAIKTYLSRNIAGGGSNAQTGQIVAGTVGVGGPNKIFSSTNSQIIVTNSVRINGGALSGINGTMLAHQLFAAGFSNGPADQ